MNGIKVMFGVIGKMTLVSIIVINILFSCIGKSSSTCEYQKQNYREKWDFIVARTFKHPQFKFTYVIVSTDGKRILISPIQDIISKVESGDKIFKRANSKYAYWTNSYNDTIRSRIFSTYCDSFVENQTKKK